jgi:hypothetical protein
MTGSRLAAKISASLARIRELAGLKDGWLDGEGVAISAGALGMATEIYKNHAAIQAHASLFPTVEGGLQIEFMSYPLDAEIVIEASAAVRATVDIDGVECNCTPRDINNLIVAAMNIVTTNVAVLLEYDCMPVIARIKRAGCDIICLGLAEDDPLGMMMGVMIWGDVGYRLKSGKIDFRTAILDPHSHIFGVTIVGSKAYLQEILDEIPEVSLPDDGLMYDDIITMTAATPDQNPG